MVGQHDSNCCAHWRDKILDKVQVQSIMVGKTRQLDHDIAQHSRPVSES